MKEFIIYSVYPSEDDVGGDEWGIEVVLNGILIAEYGDSYHNKGSDKALGFIDGYTYAKSMRKGVHYTIKYDNKVDVKCRL